jgi:hypothetical protein
MKREERVWQEKQEQDIKSVHKVARYTEINIKHNVLISGNPWVPGVLVNCATAISEQ